MSTSARADIIRRFNLPMDDEDSIDVLITSMKIGGVSWNLQAQCHTMIILEIPENLQSFYQAIGRVYRVGQPEEVSVYLIWMDRSFDQICLQAFYDKGVKSSAVNVTSKDNVADIAAEQIRRVLGMEYAALDSSWKSTDFKAKGRHILRLGHTQTTPQKAINFETRPKKGNNSRLIKNPAGEPAKKPKASKKTSSTRKGVAKPLKKHHKNQSKELGMNSRQATSPAPKSRGLKKSVKSTTYVNGMVYVNSHEAALFTNLVLEEDDLDNTDAEESGRRQNSQDIPVTPPPRSSPPTKVSSFRLPRAPISPLAPSFSASHVQGSGPPTPGRNDDDTAVGFDEPLPLHKGINVRKRDGSPLGTLRVNSPQGLILIHCITERRPVKKLTLKDTSSFASPPSQKHTPRSEHSSDDDVFETPESQKHGKNGADNDGLGGIRYVEDEELE